MWPSCSAQHEVAHNLAGSAKVSVLRWVGRRLHHMRMPGWYDIASLEDIDQKEDKDGLHESKR
jgi:hypothetical protein